MEIKTDDRDAQLVEQPDSESRRFRFYRVRFRSAGHVHIVKSRIDNLLKGEVVMLQTDHGPEPACVLGIAVQRLDTGKKNAGRGALSITRRSTRDEAVKYDKLGEMEKDAFALCLKHIEKHKLPMKLARVERFFNGGKIIFYFTAESRVDFRELVKNLVQEFRTRVEMRQIGVRHETKMIGGLGCCGRELCCSSFIKKFESVSIKMAKEQNLPLNPAKISGACNRLLCCLTYEFDNYKACRKKMPKIGKRIRLHDKNFKVRRHNILKEEIVVLDEEGGEHIIGKEEWQIASAVAPVEQSRGPAGGRKK